MDAHEILWTDTGPYQQRYEKTATALMAVERALHLRRPLRGGEDEFLALCGYLAAAPPETFTTIWEDPFSYFWARLAYELTGWCLNPEPLPEVLASYCASLGTDDPSSRARAPSGGVQEVHHRVGPDFRRPSAFRSSTAHQASVFDSWNQVLDVGTGLD